MNSINELENGLLALLKGEHSSLHLSFNDDNGPNYTTVREMVERDLPFKKDWVSEEEKTKAIETNRMWTLQWYPDTPVGFYSVSASSLAVLLDHVLSGAWLK